MFLDLETSLQFQFRRFKSSSDSEESLVAEVPRAKPVAKFNGRTVSQYLRQLVELDR